VLFQAGRWQLVRAVTPPGRKNNTFCRYLRSASLPPPVSDGSFDIWPADGVALRAGFRITIIQQRRELNCSLYCVSRMLLAALRGLGAQLA